MKSADIRPRVPRALAAFIAVALLAIACTDSTSEPNTPAPLRGLNGASSQDSAGNPPPPPPGGVATAGYVQGTVLGPSAPGAGNDSLLTAPRVAGARIAAFPITGGTQASPTLGDEVASTVTGADGRFTLPTVPGGPYVVTVTPPAGSVYGGVWVTGTIHDQSHLFPWWVVLWKK
jgi:hypothetical protein